MIVRLAVLCLALADANVSSNATKNSSANATKKSPVNATKKSPVKSPVNATKKISRKQTRAQRAKLAASQSWRYRERLKNGPVIEKDTEWLSKNGGFLVENREHSDVVTLLSGLQYKVLSTGTRGESRQQATDNSTVSCSYNARLVDDTVFDTSDLRGDKVVQFKPKDVLAGLSEGVKRMGEGDTWEFYIPHALGFGAVEMDLVKPFSTLIYKFTLEKVTNGKKYEAPKEIKRNHWERSDVISRAEERLAEAEAFRAEQARRDQLKTPLELAEQRLADAEKKKQIREKEEKRREQQGDVVS